MKGTTHQLKLQGAFRKYFEVVVNDKNSVLKLHMNNNDMNSFATSKYFIEHFQAQTIFAIHYAGVLKYAYFDNDTATYIDSTQSIVRSIKILEQSEIINCEIYPIIIFSYERIGIFPDIDDKPSDVKYTLHKTLKYFVDIYAVFKKSQALNVLQVINSPNDHIAHGHQTEDVVVEIAYYDEWYEHISTFEIAVHYCKKCNLFYDYRHSFETQIKNAGINGKNLITKIIDAHGEKIAFSSGYFREKSLLKILGYAVGTSGYTDEWRRNVLDTAVSQGIMTPGEIKRHINMLINLSQNRAHMEVAITDWENDIEYVNEQIKNHNYYN